MLYGKGQNVRLFRTRPRTLRGTGGRMLVRLGPDACGAALEKPGCSPMEMRGKAMNDYVFVDEAELNTTKKLSYWINLALKFNEMAKALPKKENGVFKKRN